MIINLLWLILSGVGPTTVAGFDWTTASLINSLRPTTSVVAHLR